MSGSHEITWWNNVKVLGCSGVKVIYYNTSTHQHPIKPYSSYLTFTTSWQTTPLYTTRYPSVLAPRWH